MGKISKITVQKQLKDRYNIFFENGNGDEYAFSVDQDVFIKYQLKKGMELDSLLLNEIQYQDDILKAYHKAINYISKRMRTKKEIEQYLKEKQYDDFIIKEVMLKLLEQKYIDDHEYTYAFVRTQMNTTDKGPELIKRELKEKGVSSIHIENAIKEFPLELQIQKVQKIAVKLVQKKTKDSWRLVKQKLEQMLVRKGYSFQVIQMSIDEMDIEENDSELEALRYQGEKAHRKYSSYKGFEYEQKMKQYLFRKGFSIDLIDRYLEEK